MQYVSGRDNGEPGRLPGVRRGLAWSSVRNRPAVFAYTRLAEWQTRWIQVPMPLAGRPGSSPGVGTDSITGRGPGCARVA